jgi:hypothetical protein
VPIEVALTPVEPTPRAGSSGAPFNLLKSSPESPPVSAALSPPAHCLMASPL